MKRKFLAAVLIASLGATLLAGCSGSAENGTQGNKEKKDIAVQENGKNGGEEEEITLLITVSDGTSDGIMAVTEKAEEELGIHIEVEEVGTDADTLVKTRLASGDLPDLITYNTGSLFEALNPKEYFADLSSYDIVNELDETYKENVTIDGAVYGIPVSSTSNFVVLYNKDKYNEYDLQIPNTWEQFLENCEILKSASENAVIGAFGDIWTAQFPFLGDYYNIVAADPDFAKKFEAGELKYAETEYALESFQKCCDLTEFYNEDYLATTYNDGCDRLANGEGCQWFCSTMAVANIAQLYDKETADKIGAFAIPGNDEQNCGLTVGEPGSFYINKDTENMDAIIEFLEFYISQEGIDTYAATQMMTGTLCVKDRTIPEEYQLEVINDMQKYFDDGKVHVAQEFECAVKGPNCAAICQEVGSGQTTAKEAAQKYDEDCYKQAIQLGLGWKK